MNDRLAGRSYLDAFALARKSNGCLFVRTNEMRATAGLR